MQTEAEAEVNRSDLHSKNSCVHRPALKLADTASITVSRSERSSDLAASTQASQKFSRKRQL